MKPDESIHAFANTTAHLVLRLQQENMVLSPWSLMATILMQNLGGINLKLLTKQAVWLKGLVLEFGALVDWPGLLSLIVKLETLAKATQLNSFLECIC